MFKDLKPYEDYVGQEATASPAHWERRSLGSLLTQISERDRPDLPLLSVARERGVFVRSAGDANHNVIPDDLTNYKVARRGNLVINKMKAWQGSMGIAPVDGVVSPAYFVYDLRIENLEYAHLLLRSKPYVAKYAAASDGVRVGQWDLVDARFRRIRVALPPVEEQRAIVTYLAHAHQRINKAIATKCRLIALLDEQRQALVDGHVLGVDSRTDVKESGQPWLGKIPSHWTIVPLKRYWTVTDCKHLTVPYFDEGFPLVSVTQAQRFTLDVSDSRFTDRRHLELLWEGGRRPRRGDLIYCRNVAPGKATVVTRDADVAMGQDVALLRSGGEDPVYLNHFLRSHAMRRQMDLVMIGSTFKRINVEQIRSFLIVRPPLNEQQEIVARIEGVVSPLDAAIAAARREVELLNELKTRLTSDVVTGQIDVRSIAASLPSIALADVFAASASADDADEDETADVADMEDE